MLTENQLKIAVCDDDPADRAQIITMTGEILHRENVSYSITEYESGEELLRTIKNGVQFHIMLLDVMMQGMDGIELAALLRQLDDKAAVIFISINREMALRGYEVAACRYLAKPLCREKLEEALTHCQKMWLTKKEILLPTRNGQHRISVSDIQFVEAFDRGTRFVLNGETIETKLKFGEVEAMLPKSAFVLCHRAYLANLTQIKRIRLYEFEMKSGVIVPISRYRYNEVSKRFFDYIAD